MSRGAEVVESFYVKPHQSKGQQRAGFPWRSEDLPVPMTMTSYSGAISSMMGSVV